MYFNIVTSEAENSLIHRDNYSKTGVFRLIFDFTFSEIFWNFFA